MKPLLGKFHLWTSKGDHLENAKLIVKALRLSYKENENVLSAEKMSKYVRNQFQYFGIKTPDRRKIEKDVMDHYPENNLSQAEIYCLIGLCWEEENREFQYFAQELLFRRMNIISSKSGIYDPMDLLKCLIVNKSWWDTIDMLSSKALGYFGKHEPDHALPIIDEWIKSENMWLRRSALLYQLSYKKMTDESKLFRYCSQCCHEKEFFIQKAIGWTLREYAKTNPSAVIKYVKTNKKKLSNLSKREALKHQKIKY